MVVQPHSLYILASLSATRQLAGGCFLHNLTTSEMAGFAGSGIHVSHYINLERNNSLEINEEVLVEENNKEIARGLIREIRHTFGLMGNYTTIYI